MDVNILSEENHRSSHGGGRKLKTSVCWACLRIENSMVCTRNLHQRQPHQQSSTSSLFTAWGVPRKEHGHTRRMHFGLSGYEISAVWKIPGLWFMAMTRIGRRSGSQILLSIFQTLPVSCYFTFCIIARPPRMQFSVLKYSDCRSLYYS